jgi:hypothetical protein
MAKRRMFSISFMESDEFYELSPLTQALYFHLNLNADDDGIVDKVKSVMRDLGATKRNYSTLIDNGYIIELNSRVIAITHWHQHNRIKSDRYTETNYKELIKCLTKDENDRYIKALSAICGDKCAPQESIVKDSTVKDSTGKGSIAKNSEGEEKEEEKNNLSFLHSYKTEENLKISSYDGFAEEPTGVEIDHTRFLAKLKLYFMKNYKRIDCNDFIAHYDSMNWIGDRGESVKDNYAEYLRRWYGEP